jgi:hypothetical protein
VHLTEPATCGASGLRSATRASPELRTEYAEWRQAHGGGKPYTASKWPLAARVLAARGITLKPDAERLSTVS